MTQVKTRLVTLKSIIVRAEFGRGYYQALAGEPYVDEERNITQQWSYERGRHFACYMKSIGMTNMKLKRGKAVSLDAIYNYSQALRCKAII